MNRFMAVVLCYRDGKLWQAQAFEAPGAMRRAHSFAKKAKHHYDRVTLRQDLGEPQGLTLQWRSGMEVTV
jgi:hypothetical protein